MPTIEFPPEYLPKPFIPTVTFKDGSVIQARGGINKVTDELWIYPSDGMTFGEAYNLFSNFNKTDSIRIDHSAIQYDTADHYTRLVGIMENPPGQLAIRLRKE